MGKNVKRQRRGDDEAATAKGSPDKSQAPAEKRLPAAEPSSPGKENTPVNSQVRGADKKEEEEEGAGQLELDKYGFCVEDGHRYVDGTAPKDFPAADPDFVMRNECLGVHKKTPTGLEFSGRYVLLRGRGENGKLYSKPTLFLIKEEKGGGGGGERNYEIFSLPDDLTFGLRDFTETVGKQIMGLVWKKSKRI